ncbi:rhomboid family intramembrane serine protease [Lutibaculum baratangense]|uniref:Rhomboid family serine protease n=1 Tax=Lutibaculum baratangense AMV1 TaxID=631454 RepID=V4RFK9_9HYPH|nr:rhomboid family intramembrane serine protease [Lutibaculum baratangense]ESR24174.1 rhomboid family serine protease [Lutibaculum baratangense AMV1]
MFIPISDDNPLRHLPFQYVTVSLIAVMTAIHAFVALGAPGSVEVAAVSFGVIPAVFNDYQMLPAEYVVVPENLTLLTYQFFHGDWLHLLGNMLFLWVFGDNVEDAMGHLRFLAFYLLCGIGAGLAHAVLFPDSVAPLIGASGAAAGVIAAYLMLHPRVKVWILVLWRVPLRLSAMYVLGFWVAWQLVMAAGAVDEGVAWWAHVGGMLTGAALVPFFRRRGVPLFDRGLVATQPPDVR